VLTTMIDRIAPVDTGIAGIGHANGSGGLIMKSRFSDPVRRIRPHSPCYFCVPAGAGECVAQGETTRTIIDIMSSASQTSLPGATVTSNRRTALKRSVKTDNAGWFNFPRDRQISTQSGSRPWASIRKGMTMSRLPLGRNRPSILFSRLRIATGRGKWDRKSRSFN
jgi:hypothetical protein